jgi:hypothetical protein
MLLSRRSEANRPDGTIGTGVLLHHRRSSWWSRTSETKQNTNRRRLTRVKLTRTASQQMRKLAR